MNRMSVEGTAPGRWRYGTRLGDEPPGPGPDQGTRMSTLVGQERRTGGREVARIN
jgi:hypothetical protein